LYSRRSGDCRALTTTDIGPATPSATQHLPSENPGGPSLLEGYLLSDAHVTSSSEFSIEDMKLSLWMLDRDSGRSYVTTVTGPQQAPAGSG